ncbi:MAG: neutral/alkaline non-lysosomal ceramidase N-terminal domain-containing protein [Candidatus Latescibacterota bacterium]
MQAGTAKVEITPTTDVWMDGMVRNHRSVGVHDPLFARALFLTSGAVCEGFVVVSVDVCTFREADVRAIRQEAEARTGMPEDHIIVAATHTHSGPATFGYFNPIAEDYTLGLIGRLVAVIEKAVANARPAAAGWASGREDTISHYRRLLAKDGHVVMNWETYPAEDIVGPLGTVDPEVGVLKIVDAEDPKETLCVLFNHAGHPNVMSGDNYLISADYPGCATRLLEESFGGTSIFTNGAQGTMDIDGLRDRDWEGVDRIGTALSEAVAGIARKVAPSAQPTVRGSHVRYALPARKITDSELAWAEQTLGETEESTQTLPDGVGDDFLAALYKRLREVQDDPIGMEQICIAVDDTVFLSVPGELFTEIGSRIKAESPFRHTWLIGLANGSVGYLPTRKAIEEGGYAVDTRRVNADAEEIIVRESVRLLRNVHDPVQSECR